MTHRIASPPAPAEEPPSSESSRPTISYHPPPPIPSDPSIEVTRTFVEPPRVPHPSVPSRDSVDVDLSALEEEETPAEPPRWSKKKSGTMASQRKRALLDAESDEAVRRIAKS